MGTVMSLDPVTAGMDNNGDAPGHAEPSGWTEISAACAHLDHRGRVVGTPRPIAR